MNRLRNFFIGEYLAQENDMLKRASVTLMCNIMLLAVFTLFVIIGIYIMNDYVLQIRKGVIILFLFLSCLFYLKIFKKTGPIGHLMILISWTNIQYDVFFLFHGINMFAAFIGTLNVIFAFHVLGSRWGFFYSGLHFISYITFLVINAFNLVSNPMPIQELTPSEAMVSFVLVFSITVYLVYHYHQAFELAKHNLDLSMNELRRAKEMAEEMNRLKTNFLSNMSHEIRTPINGILGISQVIELESKDKTILEYVDLQKKSGRRLLDTINSILNLSRIEAEKDQLVLKAVDINKLVHEAAASLEEVARHKGLKYRVVQHTEQLMCLSDETMLYQVVHNIVGNAIKFTERGEVTATVALCAERSWVTVRVTDTGVGISKEFLPKVFNAFEQESMGQDRVYEGSGLGLSISKKYVELLGGEIDVISEKGKGSTFEVRLPRYAPGS